MTARVSATSAASKATCTYSRLGRTASSVEEFLPFGLAVPACGQVQGEVAAAMPGRSGRQRGSDRAPIVMLHALGIGERPDLPPMVHANFP